VVLAERPVVLSKGRLMAVVATAMPLGFKIAIDRYLSIAQEQALLPQILPLLEQIMDSTCVAQNLVLAWTPRTACCDREPRLSLDLDGRQGWRLGGYSAERQGGGD
jgi:hypothetical protein